MPGARKRFGQHFLERAWADKVVRAIAPGPADVFIEIGSGRGALTRSLAASVARVIAIEIDRDLAASLRAEALPGLTIVDADFLSLSLAHIQAEVRPASALRAPGN